MSWPFPFPGVGSSDGFRASCSEWAGAGNRTDDTMTTTSAPTPSKPRRRWLQFRLRRVTYANLEPSGSAFVTRFPGCCSPCLVVQCGEWPGTSGRKIARSPTEVEGAVFVEDLNTHAYFARGDNVRAVGWLEAGHRFARGPVPAEFLAALKVHVAKAFQPVIFMGSHRCSLCAEGGRNRRGHHNLLVPTAGLLYVAPELVVHYIEDHGYQPPVEFIAAVLACPEQESAAYFELVRPFESSWCD
jgi:hypothetical protein